MHFDMTSSSFKLVPCLAKMCLYLFIRWLDVNCLVDLLQNFWRLWVIERRTSQGCYGGHDGGSGGGARAEGLHKDGGGQAQVVQDSPEVQGAPLPYQCCNTGNSLKNFVIWKMTDFFFIAIRHWICFWHVMYNLSTVRIIPFHD